MKYRNQQLQRQLKKMHQSNEFIQQNKLLHEQCSDIDIFEILSSVLVSIGKSQQIVQCMREVLVTDPTFTPMILFKYLSKNSSLISKQHLIKYLDQNNLVSNDRQIDYFLKKIFYRYGINLTHGINYTSFLNFIYPYNSSILRQILNNKIKKYPQIEKSNKITQPNQSIITSFLLLIQQQIKTQKNIQYQINNQKFPKKQQLKKIIKLIKKTSQKNFNHNLKYQNHDILITQLRNFIKTFMNVQDHLFLYLGRRLGLTKSGTIPTQNIQNTLKKSRKASCKPSHIINDHPTSTHDRLHSTDNIPIDKTHPIHLNKHTKQFTFKQQLYKQLANTLKNKQPHRTRTPRTKSSTHKNNGKTPHKRVNNDITNYLQPIQNLQNPINQKPNQQPHKNQNIDNKQNCHQQTKQKNTLNPNNQQLPIYSLFKQFILTFLKFNKQIQSSKSKLNTSTNNIDYLQLFKILDQGKGVIDQKCLKNLYIKLSGIQIQLNFQHLIDRYSQPKQKHLSYSQFSSIFLPNHHNINKINTNINPTITNNINPNSFSSRSSSIHHDISQLNYSSDIIKLILQIMYLNIQMQQILSKILIKFNKNDIQFLFHQINIDSQSKGFINYQQLKKFLTEQLNINIQMIDLMALLKRFDKSKNGVVVKQEFLTF